MLNGIARCMAPSGLKKPLSFEAMRLFPLERVQQRLHPERRFGEQREMFEVTKISSKDRILQRTGEPDSRGFGDGGAVGGSGAHPGGLCG